MDPTIRKHAGAALVAVASRRRGSGRRLLRADRLRRCVDPDLGRRDRRAWSAAPCRASPIAGVAAAAGICLGALALLAGLSIGWASDQGRAFDEAVRGIHLSGAVHAGRMHGEPRGAPAVAGRPDRGPRRWSSVLALLSQLQPGLLEDGELGSLIPAAADRLSLPIGYWNGLAALLAAAVLLLAHAAADANRAAERSAAVGMLPLALLAIWLDGLEGRRGRDAGRADVARRGLATTAPGSWRAIAIGAVAGAVLIAASERIDGDGLTVIVAGASRCSPPRPRLAAGRACEPRFSRRLAPSASRPCGRPALPRWRRSSPPTRPSAFDEFKQPPAGNRRGRRGPPATTSTRAGAGSSGGRPCDAFESAPAAGIGAGAYEDWWAQNGHDRRSSCATRIRCRCSRPPSSALLGAAPAGSASPRPSAWRRSGGCRRARDGDGGAARGPAGGGRGLGGVRLDLGDPGGGRPGGDRLRSADRLGARARR